MRFICHKIYWQQNIREKENHQQLFLLTAGVRIRQTGQIGDMYKLTVFENPLWIQWRRQEALPTWDPTRHGTHD